MYGVEACVPAKPYTAHTWPYGDHAEMEELNDARIDNVSICHIT